MNVTATSALDNGARAKQRPAAKPHFGVMDGLRGVAAILVVALHAFPEEQFPLKNAQLAVDLFFLLSGFVVSYSYSERLESRMTVAEFLLRRAIRLYPMILIGATGGLLIGLAHALTSPIASSEGYTLHSVFSSGLLSLFGLPYLASPLNDKIFSFNAPLWSLFFELFANVIYAVFAKRLSIPVLLIVVVLGVAGVVMGGPLGGSMKDTFWLGFPRVMCGFFGGVLLHKLWLLGRLPRFSTHLAVLVGVMLVIFGWPQIIGGWLYIPAFAILAWVVVSACFTPTGRLDGLCALLGEVSYPLYVIHWLTMYGLMWLATRTSTALPLTESIVLASINLVGAPVLAYGFARFYDKPVRAMLTKLVFGRGAE